MLWQRLISIGDRERDQYLFHKARDDNNVQTSQRG